MQANKQGNDVPNNLNLPSCHFLWDGLKCVHINLKGYLMPRGRVILLLAGCSKIQRKRWEELVVGLVILDSH